MKPIYRVAALFSLAIIIWGCPYESKVGLDAYSSENINNDLLGTWRKSSYPADSAEIIFSKKTDHQYSIKATIGDGLAGYEHHNFIGFFSKINDGWLLNVFDNDNPAYYFVAVYLNGNSLSLKPLSEDITSEKFNTEAEIRKFIEQLYANRQVKYDDETEISGLIKVQ